MLENLRYALRKIVGDYYLSLYLVVGICRGKKETICQKDTSIVIEGFPRSANTFSVAAFKIANPYINKIARHHHSIGQLKAAKKFGVPAVVVIRDPEQAIVSLLVRRPKVSPVAMMWDYLSFYNYVVNNKDYLSIVDFNDVVSTPSSLMTSLAGKYNIIFKKVNDDKKTIEDILKLVDDMERADSGGEIRVTHLARPVSSNEKSKAQEEAKLKINQYPRLLKKCKTIYKELLNSL